MKKLLLLAAVLTAGLGAMAACTDSEAPASAATPSPTLAETNAGIDSETYSDTEATVRSAATASDPVLVLKNDNLYRPGKKVKRLTVIDFNATWCGPCRQFAPIFHEAAKKFGKQVDFVSIDTDVNPNTAAAFGITSIPTVIFIWPSGKTQRFVGTQDIMPQSKFNAIVQGAM